MVFDKLKVNDYLKTVVMSQVANNFTSCTMSPPAHVPTPPRQKPAAAIDPVKELEFFICKFVLPYGDRFKFTYCTLQADRLAPLLKNYRVEFVRVLRYSFIIRMSFNDWLLVRETGISAIVEHSPQPDPAKRGISQADLLDSVEYVTIKERDVAKLSRVPYGEVMAYRLVEPGMTLSRCLSSSSQNGGGLYVVGDFVHIHAFHAEVGDKFCFYYQYLKPDAARRLYL